MAAALMPRADAPTRAAKLLALAVGVATALVFLFRQPGSALDTPWAEDGQVFLSGAYRDGLSSVFTPYAGYLHLYPRLIALVAAAVPVPDAAAVLAVGGVLAAGLAAGIAVLATGAWIRSLALRTVLGLFLVVFPYGADEVAANVANAHWFFIAAAALTLAWRTCWRPATGWTVLLVLLAVGSDPLTGLLLPIAALRVLAVPLGHGSGAGRADARLERRAAVAPAVALVLGLALQAVPAVSTFGSTGTGRARPALVDLVVEFARHVPATVLLGEHGARPASAGVLAACAGAVVLALILLGLRRPAALLAAGVATCYSAVFWVLPNYLRSISQVDTRGVASFAANARYSVIPLVLLGVVLLTALDAAAIGRGDAAERDPRTARRVRAATLGLAVAAGVGVGLAQVPDLGSGIARAPSWSAGVQAARAHCAAAQVNGTDPGDTVDIPIAPATWQVPLPCSRLTKGS